MRIKQEKTKTETNENEPHYVVLSEGSNKLIKFQEKSRREWGKKCCDDLKKIMH